MPRSAAPALLLRGRRWTFPLPRLKFGQGLTGVLPFIPVRDLVLVSVRVLHQPLLRSARRARVAVALFPSFVVLRSAGLLRRRCRGQSSGKEGRSRPPLRSEPGSNMGRFSGFVAEGVNAVVPSPFVVAKVRQDFVVRELEAGRGVGSLGHPLISVGRLLGVAVSIGLRPLRLLSRRQCILWASLHRPPSAPPSSPLVRALVLLPRGFPLRRRHPRLSFRSRRRRRSRRRSRRRRRCRCRR
mmetsp:Transcript_44720/g.136437  ORF Transcript_44720/g.136437 Transcript_44720/m.136437 type:complete len:241 (+) Transcript_44720:967-1689(+)